MQVSEPADCSNRLEVDEVDELNVMDVPILSRLSRSPITLDTDAAELMAVARIDEDTDIAAYPVSILISTEFWVMEDKLALHADITSPFGFSRSVRLVNPTTS